MKFATSTALALCLAGAAAAAYEDEGLPETLNSTDTVKNGEDEEEQPLIQENDEDLAAFVTDYIRKDILLKGAFFIEDKALKKILRLEPASVEPKAAVENGVKTVTAHLKDAAGKKFTVLFRLQSGPWGGLDILKIELKDAPGKAAPGKKQGV